MTTPQHPDPLELALREAEARLDEDLEEACDTENAAKETTGELIRLEETLVDAATAAKEAITLRRQRRQRAEAATGHQPEDVSAHRPSDLGAGVRQLRDPAGRAWQVWRVTPSQARSREDAERYLGEYQAGWLVFEALEGGERRRLVSFPTDWQGLSDADLLGLLERAAPARRRESGGEAGEAGEPRA